MAAKGVRVSVIMNFLNEARFIEEAIASVYAQTFPHWELILVDDGSTDESTSIARHLAARDAARVRYLDHPRHENRGMSASRNLGIAHARGDFIAFLDADDVYLPERLERGVALLDEHPEADMAYGRTRYWRSWSGSRPGVEDWIQPHGFRADRTVPAPTLLIMHLMNDASLPCMCSITARRETVLASGGFVDAFRGLFEDQAFLARFCLRHDVYVADENWDCYRQHPDSSCARAETRGEAGRARDEYLAWLRSHLEEQGMHKSPVWAALRYAAAARTERWWRRLIRPAVRWAMRIAIMMRRASFAPERAVAGDPPQAEAGDRT